MDRVPETPEEIKARLESALRAKTTDKVIVHGVNLPEDRLPRRLVKEKIKTGTGSLFEKPLSISEDLEPSGR